MGPVEAIKIDPWLGKAKDLLVLIPALHLFCCFIYLFAYYWSFGHGLIYFASPSEVFSVSMSKVAPLYISLAVGLAFGAWSYESEDEINQRYSETSAKLVKSSRKWQSRLISIVVFITFLHGLLASFLSDYIFWLNILLPVFLLLPYVLGYFWPRQSSAWLLFRPTAWLFVAILAVFGFGLIDGQLAAKIKVDLESEELSSCDEVLILKDVGDRFLAVDSDNNRVVVSENCDVIFGVVDGKEVAFEKEPSSVKVIVDHFRK